MSGVTELNTDGMDGTIESTPFYNDEKGVEEVYLPNIEKLTYPMFYNCINLKKVDFPKSIKHLDAFLAKCPNVEEIYVPEDLQIDCDCRFDSDICFMGSGKSLFLIMRDGLMIWKIYNPISLHLMESFIQFPMVDVFPSIVIRQEMKGRSLISQKVFTSLVNMHYIAIPI